jgi:hypothetical protein
LDRYTPTEEHHEHKGYAENPSGFFVLTPIFAARWTQHRKKQKYRQNKQNPPRDEPQQENPSNN